MTIKFDKDKFLHLLKERKQIQKEAIFFWDYDKKNHELTRYLIILEENVF